MKLKLLLSSSFLTVLTILTFFKLSAQNALSFDGINDFIDCGNHSSIDITGNNFSIEAWVYPTSFKANVWEGTAVAKADVGTNGYMLRVGNGGQVNFNIGTGSWNELNSAVGAITLNNWYHLAGTYDGSMMRLYIDGILTDSLAVSASIGSTSTNLYIGEDPQWRGRYFPGKIDDVRIWNDARTPLEIKSYLTNEFCDSSNLVAWYQFDQGVALGTNTNDTVAFDVLGNSNGILNNFSLSSNSSNWALGAPIYKNSQVDVQVACGTYTWLDGINYGVSNNTARYIIPGGAMNGCDSVVLLDLTIVPNVTSTDVQVACGAYTWIDGNTYTSNNNTAIDTIVRGSVNGCDSIITLDLTIVPNLTRVDTRQAIGSYTWIDGVTYTTSNTTATHTIVGAGPNGCDSVITLDLTILTVNGENSLEFDGIDDYVDCGNNIALDITGNSITLEAWVYPTSFKNTFWAGNVVNKAATGEVGYMLRVGGTGEVNFNIGTGVWNEITSPANAVGLNSWHHIAGTYDGTTMILYVDGIQVNSAPLTANIGSVPNPLYLGEDPQWRGRYFPGRIEDVRVWSDARTVTEINDYMFGEFCDSTNLVAWYKFNHGTPTLNNTTFTALDDMTGVNNGILQNFALAGNTSNWTNGLQISDNRNIDAYVECGPFTWIDGNTYITDDSTASVVLPGAARNGCDSIIQLNLTIVAIDTGITHNGMAISSNQAGANYQWLDCGNGNNYTVISGETNQSYVLGTAGSSYAVEITLNGCVDTSVCFTPLLSSINEPFQQDNSFSIAPNPTTGKLLIQLGNQIETNGPIQIYSVKGDLVYESILSSSFTTLDLSSLKAGLYLIRYADKSKKVAIRR